MADECADDVRERVNGIAGLIAGRDGGDEREALDLRAAREAWLVITQKPPQHGGELQLERPCRRPLAALVLRERRMQLTEGDAVGDRHDGIGEARPTATRVGRARARIGLACERRWYAKPR